MFGKSALALFIFGLLCTPTLAQNLILNKPGSQLLIIGKQQLGPKAKSEFRNFRKNTNFFGALAVNAAEDKFGYTYDYHDLDTARRNAIKICRGTSAKPSNCKEYALVVPKDYNQSAKGVSLSQSAQKFLKGPFRSKQKKGLYAAFAIHERSSNFGYSWSHSDPKSASDTAMLECQAGVANAVAKAGANIRKSLNLNRVSKCKVVYT